MNTKITLVTSRLLYLLVFLIISHVAKAQADVWDGLTATEPAGWTAGNAAVNISSAVELAWVAKMVNEDRQTGSTASDKQFKGCTLTLTTDIDLAGHEWTPIGIGLSNTYLSSIDKNCFRGTFDGQNHTISNLKIRGTHTFAGLFGIIGDASFPTPGNGGLVKNLHIENADIELTTPSVTGGDYYYVGALAGLKGGDVMDGCSATGKIVTGEKVYVGGLVGMNYGGYGTCSIITNCYASVDVTAGSGVEDTYPKMNYIGGFVGKNGTTSGGYPIIYNCYSTGNVKGGDYANIGGFIGESVSSSNDLEANDVHSCYSLGTVEGGSTDVKVGGFAGNAGTRSTLLNCYWNQDAYAKGTGNDAERTTENLLPVPADVSNNSFLLQRMNQGAYNYSTTKGAAQTSLLKKYAWELLPGSEHPTLTQTELTAAIDLIGTTDANPYEIGSPAALKTFANVVNAGSDFDGEFVKLTADIDLDSEEWTPIGNSDSNPFKGTFDGNGYQVQNLYINKISGESITSGLFGWLNSGTIQNLGVVISEKGLTMKVTNSGVGDSQLGGIVGLGQKATLKNCYVTGGAISGNVIGSASYLGGVVGSWTAEAYQAIISNCYSTVDIYNGEETKGSHSVSGGIIGYMDNHNGNAGIANCFSSGIISAKDPSDAGGAGGILGYAVRYGSNNISIKNSLALNYKLITKDGDVACFVGRILGESSGSGVSFNFQDNYAYDNIVWDDLTNSTSNPITGSNAADKNGADWDWRSNAAIPTSTLDNTSNWETGVLPVMPKLKTTTGVLMANQPDVSIPYPLEFAVTTHGAVRAKYYKTYAGAGTRVELVIAPDQNFLLGSLTYQPEGENAVAITENAGHYYFTMPGKKTTIAAVFNVKSDITIASVTNGAISIEGNKTEALDGDKITFTATPANGYKLSGLPTVTKAGGGNVTVNSEGNNKYSFDMPDDAVTIAATFSKDNPDPQPPVTPDPEPTVYYTVALPSVEGATTDPVAGEYEVEAWGSFRFYLTLDKGYDQSEPIVTTDRGEAITPRSSDGAYIVKYVRQPVEIRIEGVVKNPDPVANETIAADGIGVRTADGCLYISVTTEVRAAVYNFNGRLLKQARILPGQTRWQFPSGAYIVEVDGKRYKVML